METEVYRSRKLLASRTLTGDKLEEALILVSGERERGEREMGVCVWSG